MRVPGQIEVLRSPEGQSGGDAGSSASVGGGGTSEPAGSTAGSATPESSAPSGTPSSAPSSDSSARSPSTVDPSTVDDGAPTDAFDFNALLNGQFADGEVMTPPIAAPVVVPPAVPGAPGTPPATPPTAAPPAVAPVAPPAAAPSGQPPLSLAEPGRLAEAMASQEAAIVDEAARTMFALSPEEVTGLEENAVATIPRLLARTYVQAQRSMLTTLQRALPAMLGVHLSQKEKHDSNESRFYDRWKDSGIDRAKHGPLVTRLATMYRKMNPAANFDQMVEELGPAIVMAAKIQPPQAQPGGPLRAGNGLVRPQPSPFVPAGGGPGAISNQPQGEAWDILDPGRME